MLGMTASTPSSAMACRKASAGSPSLRAVACGASPFWPAVHGLAVVHHREAAIKLAALRPEADQRTEGWSDLPFKLARTEK